jgi:hypothetical protein
MLSTDVAKNSIRQISYAFARDSGFTDVEAKLVTLPPDPQTVSDEDVAGLNISSSSTPLNKVDTKGMCLCMMYSVVCDCSRIFALICAYSRLFALVLMFLFNTTAQNQETTTSGGETKSPTTPPTTLVPSIKPTTPSPKKKALPTIRRRKTPDHFGNPVVPSVKKEKKSAKKEKEEVESEEEPALIAKSKKCKAGTLTFPPLPLSSTPHFPTKELDHILDSNSALEIRIVELEDKLHEMSYKLGKAEGELKGMQGNMETKDKFISTLMDKLAK